MFPPSELKKAKEESIISEFERFEDKFQKQKLFLLLEDLYEINEFIASSGIKKINAYEERAKRLMRAVSEAITQFLEPAQPVGVPIKPSKGPQFVPLERIYKLFTYGKGPSSLFLVRTRIKNRLVDLNNSIVQVKVADQNDKLFKKTVGGSTCPLMSVRNADLLLDYLFTGKEKYLKALSNIKDAINFANLLKKKKVAIQSLTQEGVLEIIKALDLKKKNITVLDSVILADLKKSRGLPTTMGEDTALQIIDVKNNLINKDNFAHAFVVGTADAIYFASDLAVKKKMIQEGVTDQEFYSSIGGMHWICVVVAKVKGEYFWFVADSSKRADHLKGRNRVRIDFLIDCLFDTMKIKPKHNYEEYYTRILFEKIDKIKERKQKKQRIARTKVQRRARKRPVSKKK